MGVLMYVSQVIMSQLPNIEIVSLLIILVTCRFGIKALVSVYIFVVCEILTYGVSLWVINYLYVWAVLCIIILMFKNFDNSLIFALISSIFGLCFGTLCSIPYFFIGGAPAGFGNIIAGLWFDIIHCIANFILAMLLYKPLKKVLDKATDKYL